MIINVNGDIRDAETDIAHGVNCQNTMGSGVAKALYEKWPEVKKQYHTFCSVWKPNHGPLLGRVNTVLLPSGKHVHNLFTQYNYGYDSTRRYVNYAAIVDCFKYLLRLEIHEISIPLIGCGLAGGTWDIVEPLIDDTVMDSMDVYAYHY